MFIIETFYLIDYENVGHDGMEGCENLTTTDNIHLFFTQNASKIDLSIIANYGKAKLKVHEVPSGKQSADIHIASYLGFLSGIYKGKDCKVIIISKDTDFDNVIKFWKSETGINVSRNSKISMSITKNANKKQPNPTTVKIDGTQKTKLNTEVQRILSNANFDQETVHYVASLVVKNANIKNRKQQIYRNIVSKYGQKRGLNIYNHIKKKI